jgi:3D (Asp-Asp-Asp) domain-containing protein
MRFNFAGSSSVTLTNVSFSTNTTDIEYTWSGVLTVTISWGSTPTTNASGSGSIVLVAPAKGIIFSGLLATSQVVVYATGTTTERFRVNSSWTWETYTATIEEDVDYTILLPWQVPIRKTVTVWWTQVAEWIQQVVDRAYVASSGLVYTTDATANESTKIFTLTKASTLQNYYSFMMEEWKDNDTGANQNLRNVTFPIIPNWPNSFTLDDTWEFAWSTDIAFLSRDWLRYLDASSVETAAWSAILTTWDVTWFTAEIQQVIWAAPIDAANTWVVDELVQIYWDASHWNFNYRGYMVIKYQVAWYYQGEVDVVSTYGWADLSDELYIVSLQPTLANITASDPAVSITITNHWASPVTWNGKVYSLTITDTTWLSWTIIQQEINYNLAQDATFQSEDPFNWSDMVYDNWTKFKTERGTLINSAWALLKWIRVVQADGTTPHADFDSFMADDWTTFAPAIQVTVSAANLVDWTRYQFYNVTQASELDNALVSGGSWASLSALFWPWEVIENWDVIRMRATYQSTTTAKIPLDSEAVASSGWVSFINTQVDDSIYILYWLDWSTITKFTADFVNDEIDLIVASNFSAQELYAWWTYTLTTVQGVQEFYGWVTAIDSANLRINNATIDVFFDNTTTTNVFQSDNIRIYRSDDAYPIKNPTTWGWWIDIVWKNQIFIAETWVSWLTPAESTQLWEIDTVSTKVDKTLTTNLFIWLK